MSRQEDKARQIETNQDIKHEATQDKTTQDHTIGNTTDAQRLAKPPTHDDIHL